jgi:hypothetical protein
MKWILAISVLLNLFLGFEVWSLKSQPPLERIVVETQKSVNPLAKPLEEPPSIAKVETESRPETSDIHQLDDVLQRVSEKREEVLTQKLNMTTQELEQIEVIKKQFQTKFRDVLKTNGLRVDISLQQRKQLLEIEIQREKAFEQVLGKTRMRRFQKYKDSYNTRMIKLQEENGTKVFVPLEL